MDVLKKILTGVVLFLTITTYGQDQKAQTIINAFAKSYKLEKQGKYNEAINALQQVYDQGSYEINVRLGWLSYEAGLFQQSLSYYKRAINLMPYSIEAKFGIIYPLNALGRTNEIIQKYQEILKIAPNNYYALLYLGDIYYAQGKYTQAYPLFEKLVNQYPFDYNSVVMLGWTNFKLKKFNQAKALFNKALMIRPGDKSALQGLSLIK